MLTECLHTRTARAIQESLADTKVQCKRATAVRVWRPIAEKSTANQRKEHNAEKYYLGGYNAVADNTGLFSFV